MYTSDTVPWSRSDGTERRCEARDRGGGGPNWAGEDEQKHALLESLRSILGKKSMYL